MVPAGKDATISATNLAIAALISNYLYTHGIQLDPETIIAIAPRCLDFGAGGAQAGSHQFSASRFPNPNRRRTPFENDHDRFDFFQHDRLRYVPGIDT